MTAARSDDDTTILMALYRHHGKENGITGAGLSRLTRINERRVRECITALREEGVAICGHPSTGYYIAKTPEELERSCAFLRARAMHSLKLESRLRRIPLQDLIGQLKIPT